MKRILLAAALFSLAAPAVSQTSPADNVEMAEIVAADQAVRTGDGAVDAQAMIRADAERRQRTRVLFDHGALTTANDFYAAAFVFQHGAAPEDYLLAHVFAVRSLALGRTDAEWIAAASLDRYLHHTGKGQVYGTQYQIDSAVGAMTMEPYDRGLLTDALRVAAGVHTVEEQEEQLAKAAEMMKRFATPSEP